MRKTERRGRGRREREREERRRERERRARATRDVQTISLHCDGSFVKNLSRTY